MSDPSTFMDMLTIMARKPNCPFPLTVSHPTILKGICASSPKNRIVCKVWVKFGAPSQQRVHMVMNQSRYVPAIDSILK